MIDRRPTVLLASAALAAGLLLGCSKSQDAAPAPSSLAASARASIGEAVSAYEAIRRSLANDQGNVSTQARALADAVRTALASAPTALRQPLEDLSSASERLAALAGNDLDAARKAFGDVSRALISVLSADSGLQQHRHVYECPMAKGYKKWVQVTEGVGNPYMGNEMLKCGTEVAF